MAAATSHPLMRVLTAVVVAVVALPFVFLVIRGASLGSDFALQVARDDVTTEALFRTLALAVVVAVACVALAAPLAWLTHATDLPGRRWFRVLLILPLAIPSYVSGFVVWSAFAPGGWLPTTDVRGWLGTVIALMFTYPFALLTIQGALDRMDPRQWESARALGCSPWQACRRVVFPQLRPAMAGGALLVALYTVSDFGAVALMRFESLSYLVYLRYNSLFGRDEAVFLSLLLIAVAVVLVVGFVKLGGITHRQLSGQRRAWPTIRLGRWRWPAFGLCAAVVGAGFVAPVLIVTGWTLRGLRLGQQLPFPTNETANTVLLGVVAAVVIVAIAFVPTLAYRLLGRRGGWVKLVAHLGYALPGIVVALALVSFATTWAHPLYQTVTLLVIAYMVRFFPLAVHTLDDAVSAQSRAPYWAARSLGCSAPAAWARVVIPSAMPAVAVALLAVFIVVIKELPATLILSPVEFDTLATRIWGLTEDAYFAAASPAILTLLALATAGLLLRPDVRLRGKR